MLWAQLRLTEGLAAAASDSSGWKSTRHTKFADHMEILATFEPLFEGGITSSVSLATFTQCSCLLFVIVVVKQGVALNL